MRNTFSTFVKFLLCFSLIAIVHAQDSDQSSSQLQTQPLPKTWHTLADQRFEIHFPSTKQNHEQWQIIARKTLNLVNNAREKLLPFFGSEPQRPVQIVLSDGSDKANGFATPFPYPKMTLFLNRPSPLSGLEHNDDWLAMLITHEYAHVLHIELGRNLAKDGRNILGRLPVFFPHALLPTFLIEGLAVYLESSITDSAGRLNSAYYHLLMRAELEDGRLDPLDNVLASLLPDETNKNYLYGGFFIEFLVQRYGKSRIQTFLSRYSGEVIPWITLDYVFTQVFGKHISTVWAEFEIAMLQRFGNKKMNFPPFKNHFNYAIDLKNSDELANFLPTNKQQQILRFTRAGRYQYMSSTEDNAELRFFPHSSATNIKQSKLLAVGGLADFDVNEDQQVASIRYSGNSQSGLRASLYILKQDRWARLNAGKGWQKIRWRDSQSLYALRQQLGASELWQLDIDKANRPAKVINKKLIQRWQNNWHIGDFDISKEGALVIQAKQLNDTWDLYYLINQPSEENNEETMNHSWQRITNTSSIPFQPRFYSNSSEPMRERISYIEIDTKKTQLMAVDVYDNTQSKLLPPNANTVGYQWLPDKPYIAIQYYSEAGHGWSILPSKILTNAEVEPLPLVDVKTTSLKASLASSTLNNQRSDRLSGQLNSEQDNNIDEPIISPYRPWRYLLPTAVLPFYQSFGSRNLVGIQFNGMDPAVRHFYQGQIEYDLDHGLYQFLLSYQFNRRTLVSFTRQYDLSLFEVSMGDETSDELLITRRDRWQAQYRLPVMGNVATMMNVGVAGEYEKVIEFPEAVISDGVIEAKDYVLGLSLSNRNFQFLPEAADKRSGSSSVLIVETHDVLNDDFSGWRTQVDSSYVADLKGTKSVAARLLLGLADSSASEFRLGGSTLRDEQRLFGRQSFALPGYPNSTASGHQFIRAGVSVSEQLFRINRNLGLLPIGLGQITGKIGIDHGRVYRRVNGNDEMTRQLTGVRAELNADVIFGFRMLLPAQIGLARGLTGSDATTELYFSFGVPF